MCKPASTMDGRTEQTACKEELVRFDNVKACYDLDGPPVTLTYILAPCLNTTPQDWIGLFPCPKPDTRHPLAFTWTAPKGMSKKKKKRSKNEDRRQVSFPLGDAMDLKSSRECVWYQFVYVSKEGTTCGSSRKFQIQGDELWDLKDDDEFSRLSPWHLSPSLSKDSEISILSPYQVLTSGSSTESPVLVSYPWEDGTDGEEVEEEEEGEEVTDAVSHAADVQDADDLYAVSDVAEDDVERGKGMEHLDDWEITGRLEQGEDDSPASSSDLSDIEILSSWKTLQSPQIPRVLDELEEPRSVCNVEEDVVANVAMPHSVQQHHQPSVTVSVVKCGKTKGKKGRKKNCASPQEVGENVKELSTPEASFSPTQETDNGYECVIPKLILDQLKFLDSEYIVENEPPKTSEKKVVSLLNGKEKRNKKNKKLIIEIDAVNEKKEDDEVVETSSLDYSFEKPKAESPKSEVREKTGQTAFSRRSKKSKSNSDKSVLITTENGKSALPCKEPSRKAMFADSLEGSSKRKDKAEVDSSSHAEYDNKSGKHNNVIRTKHVSAKQEPNTSTQSNDELNVKVDPSQVCASVGPDDVQGSARREAVGLSAGRKCKQSDSVMESSGNAVKTRTQKAGKENDGGNKQKQRSGCEGSKRELKVVGTIQENAKKIEQNECKQTSEKKPRHQATEKNIKGSPQTRQLTEFDLGFILGIDTLITLDAPAESNDSYEKETLQIDEKTEVKVNKKDELNVEEWVDKSNKALVEHIFSGSIKKKSVKEKQLTKAEKNLKNKTRVAEDAFRKSTDPTDETKNIEDSKTKHQAAEGFFCKVGKDLDKSCKVSEAGFSKKGKKQTPQPKKAISSGTSKENDISILTLKDDAAEKSVESGSPSSNSPNCPVREKQKKNHRNKIAAELSIVNKVITRNKAQTQSEKLVKFSLSDEVPGTIDSSAAATSSSDKVEEVERGHKCDSLAVELFEPGRELRALRRKYIAKAKEDLRAKRKMVLNNRSKKEHRSKVKAARRGLMAEAVSESLLEGFNEKPNGCDRSSQATALVQSSNKKPSEASSKNPDSPQVLTPLSTSNQDFPPLEVCSPPNSKDSQSPTMKTSAPVQTTTVDLKSPWGNRPTSKTPSPEVGIESSGSDVTDRKQTCSINSRDAAPTNGKSDGVTPSIERRHIPAYLLDIMDALPEGTGSPNLRHWRKAMARKKGKHLVMDSSCKTQDNAATQSEVSKILMRNAKTQSSQHAGGLFPWGGHGKEVPPISPLTIYDDAAAAGGGRGVGAVAVVEDDAEVAAAPKRLKQKSIDACSPSLKVTSTSDMSCKNTGTDSILSLPPKTRSKNHSAKGLPVVTKPRTSTRQNDPKTPKQRNCQTIFTAANSLDAAALNIQCNLLDKIDAKKRQLRTKLREARTIKMIKRRRQKRKQLRLQSRVNKWDDSVGVFLSANGPHVYACGQREATRVAGMPTKPLIGGEKDLLAITWPLPEKVVGTHKNLVKNNFGSILTTGLNGISGSFFEYKTNANIFGCEKSSEGEKSTFRVAAAVRESIEELEETEEPSADQSPEDALDLFGFTSCCSMDLGLMVHNCLQGLWSMGSSPTLHNPLSFLSSWSFPSL